jgi:hypothetical protein
MPRKPRTVTSSTRILDVEGKPGSFVIELWIESDPRWLEFATQARDIFNRPHGIGYWAYGAEHDPKLGWLIYEHGDERRPPAETPPAVLKAWRDGGDLPRYWYRLDTQTALRAQAEGVRLRGVDWYEEADAPFYDCIVQRAIFGEEKYG